METRFKIHSQIPTIQETLTVVHLHQLFERPLLYCQFPTLYYLFFPCLLTPSTFNSPVLLFPLSLYNTMSSFESPLSGSAIGQIALSYFSQNGKVNEKKMAAHAYMDAGIEEHLFITWRSVNVYRHCKIQHEISIKIENYVPQDPTTYVFLGTHQKDSMSYYRDTCLCMLIAGLLAIPETETIN